MPMNLPFVRPVTARERCARGVAAAVSLAALLAVVLVAIVRHPVEPPEVESAEGVPREETADAATAALSTRGREIFAARACAVCHSLRGAGNPAAPLDGVGDRLDDEAIRARIVGDASSRDRIPERAWRAKQQYADLSDEDLRALLAFLRHAP